MKNLLTILCTILTLSLSLHVSGQSNDPSPPQLKQNANYQETVDWLSRYWFSKMAIGIDDPKKSAETGNPRDAMTRLNFRKGFKLVSSDRCTLLLRNEGVWKNKPHSAYLVDATIPLSDLTAGSMSIWGHAPYRPDIDELYGLWDVKFTTRKSVLSARLYLKVPEGTMHTGSVVKFSFATESDAKQFSKALVHAVKLCQEH